MATQTWPISAQPTYNSAINYGGNVVKSETDSPIAKTRPRFTQDIPTESMSVMMNQTDRDNFVDWFENDIVGGHVEFELADPQDGVVYDWRMNGLNVQHLRKNWFRVSFTAERKRVSYP